MKGTVILRYVGNRPEPEEEAVKRTLWDVFESPPLPLEFVKAEEDMNRRKIAMLLGIAPSKVPKELL